MKEIEFKIKGLMMDPLTNSPIVVLQDTTSDTLLPIWVGIFEEMPSRCRSRKSIRLGR